MTTTRLQLSLLCALCGLLLKTQAADLVPYRISVATDTNGAVTAPTNFWTVNSTSIVANVALNDLTPDANVNLAGYGLTNSILTYSLNNFIHYILDTNSVYAIKLGDPSTLSTWNIGLTASGNARMRMGGVNYRAGTDSNEYAEWQMTPQGLGISTYKGGIIFGDANIRYGRLDGVAPQYKFQIGTNAYRSINSRGPMVTEGLTGTASENWHVFADNTRVTYEAGGKAGNSFDSYPLIDGGDNFDHFVGFQARPQFSGSGYMTNLFSFWSQAIIDGGGTVPFSYAAYFLQPSKSGGSTLNTNRIVYLGPATIGANENWSLYSDGPIRATSVTTASDPFDSAWNGDTTVPTRDDVYDAVVAKLTIPTTTANLSGTITDETGTGGLVLSNAPAIYSPTITGTATYNGTEIATLDDIAEGIVPDGDYGDITISEGGTIYSIDSGAILASDVTHSYTPINYTPSGSPSSALSSHLVGIDSALATAGGAMLTNGTTTMAADLRMGGNDLTNLGGIYSSGSVTFTIPTSSILSFRQAAGEAAWLYSGVDAGGDGYLVIAGAQRRAGTDTTEFTSATMNSNGLAITPAKGDIIINGDLEVTNTITAVSINRSAVFPTGNYGIISTADDGETFALSADASVDDLRAAGTNIAASVFDDLRHRKPQKYYITDVSGGTITIDWTNHVSIRVQGTNDITFDDINRPEDSDMEQAIAVQVTNTTASALPVDPGDFVWTSQVPLVSIPAHSEAEFLARYDGAKVKLSYESPESVVQTVDGGGTGNTNGVANGPFWDNDDEGVTSYDTNYVVNLTSAFKLISATDDVHLSASTGRTTDSSAARFQDLIIENWSGANKTLTWLDAWNTVGLVSPHTLSNETVTALRFYNWGPSETNSLLVMFGGTNSVAAGGGGSEPTVEFPSTDLLAYYTMDGASGSTVVDDYASYDLTVVQQARFTFQQTGIDNYSITNTGSSGTYGTALTVASTGLEVPADGVRTFAVWFYIGSHKTYNSIVGQYDGLAPGASWLLYTGSSGEVRVRATDDGTDDYPSWDTGLTASSGAWHLIVLVIDQTGDASTSVSLDGGEYVTKSNWGWDDLKDSSAAISFFNGLYSGSPINNFHFLGKIDEAGIWSRALSQSDVEALWNSGSGTFFTP